MLLCSGLLSVSKMHNENCFSLESITIIIDSTTTQDNATTQPNADRTTVAACDCSGEQIPDFFDSIIFISVVSGAGGVILLQSLIILCLSYCLCRHKSRCWCCVGKPKGWFLCPALRIACPVCPLQ